MENVLTKNESFYPDIVELYIELAILYTQWIF